MYDFAADSTEISNVVDEIKAAAEKISGFSADIQKGITGLNHDWKGSSYDTFSAKCAEYYPAMDTLAKILEAYATILSTTVTTAEEELCKAIKDALSL